MTDTSARAERQTAEHAAPESGARAGAAADIIYLPDGRQRRKKVTSGSNRRKREHVERFRTDDAEHKALHDRLRESNLSLGEYVMQLGKIAGREASRRRRRGGTREDKTALTQAIVAFNRAGNNQNQTVRALNELLLIAREQSNMRLESMVLELADAIRGMPDLFAEPIAAILAALHHDREG
ncbi:MAG: hypothetical protein B7Z80_15540 [Rhodospirillales bacterium 20-64-7]|nr:MAG: hypothetical protein B7Z80_15540 [Rhodospirillales bacterium 20-64-7]